MGSYSWDVSNINATVFDGGGVDLPEDYKGTTEFRLSGCGWGLGGGTLSTEACWHQGQTMLRTTLAFPGLKLCQELLPKLKPFISMPLECQ